MLEDLKEEAIVNKVGGRFKLSTLIQKRMVALNTGARPLAGTSELGTGLMLEQEREQRCAFLLRHVLEAHRVRDIHV